MLGRVVLFPFCFQQEINAAGPIISVSVFAITLSASLANLIGATKILHAVAKDKLFGEEGNEGGSEGERGREKERGREGGKESE